MLRPIFSSYIYNYCFKTIYTPLQSKGGVPQKQLEFAVVESKTLCSNIVCLIPKQSAPLRWFKSIGSIFIA